MSLSAKPSDKVAVVGAIDPDYYTTQNLTSDWVDMSEFDQIAVILSVGNLTTGATVAMSLLQGTNSTGGSSKAIASSSITSLTATTGTNDDTQYYINLSADKLDRANSFDYAAAYVTLASDTGSTLASASDLSVVILGLVPGNGPASDDDVSSVSEIISVV